MRFKDVEAYIAECSVSQIPALLRAVVRRAVVDRVFKTPGDMTDCVQLWASQEAGLEIIRDQQKG